MLSPGRGLRGTEFADLVRQTPEGAVANGWALSADVRDGDIDRRRRWTSTSRASRNGTRAARRGRYDAGRPAEVMRVIGLTPSMDRVFAGPTETGGNSRSTGVGPFPQPCGPAAGYEKAMRQRNVLRKVRKAGVGPTPYGSTPSRWAWRLPGSPPWLFIGVDAVKVMQEAILARPKGHSRRR